MPKLARQQAVAEGAAEGEERVSRSLTPRLGAVSEPEGALVARCPPAPVSGTCRPLAAPLATLAVTVPATGTFWAFLFLPIWPLFAKLFGLYDRDHRALRHLTADEVPSIFAWVGVTTACWLPLLSLTPVGVVEWGPRSRCSSRPPSPRSPSVH